MSGRATLGGMDADTLELIDRPLAAAVGAGDVTTEATVDAGARARALIYHRQASVIDRVGGAEALCQVGDS